jgi:hypothetical protein
MGVNIAKDVLIMAYVDGVAVCIVLKRVQIIALSILENVPVSLGDVMVLLKMVNIIVIYVFYYIFAIKMGVLIYYLKAGMNTVMNAQLQTKLLN